jgi:hypothetical protein
MPSATTGIATGVTSPNAAPRLTCQAGIAGGTSSEARASTTTTGADRAPRRATMVIVRKTARTNAEACASGSSSTSRATSTAYSGQNRRGAATAGSGMTSQVTANAASAA